jgi:hypothetical protein
MGRAPLARLPGRPPDTSASATGTRSDGGARVDEGAARGLLASAEDNRASTSHELTTPSLSRLPLPPPAQVVPCTSGPRPAWSRGRHGRRRVCNRSEVVTGISVGPGGPPLIRCALRHSPVPLCPDEFALWAHLDDVYWSERGRISFDAVVCTCAFAALVVIATTTTSAGGRRSASLRRARSSAPAAGSPISLPGRQTSRARAARRPAERSLSLEEARSAHLSTRCPQVQ